MSTGTSNGISALLRSEAILAFRLAGQEYGLPVSGVVQIVEMVTITQLPHTPPSLQGVINYHGQLVPVLDMRIHLGLPPEPYGLHTPIILIECNGRILGLIVDSVEEVLNVLLPDSKADDAIIPLELAYTNGAPSRDAPLVEAVTLNRRILLILQIESLLTQQEQIALLRTLSEHEHHDKEVLS